ncbi:hypothetical protein MYMAC_004925 [Corallococcus macrosporus DSM 14697]|uniref:Uncharacterized protein n=1 Tax=Corallococcus macrosporus DSM 14697 TaxID=1189310 RepID=A0A250K0Q0_9BACT|nr:hypothetical protein MYMAC_004925 [Corallococcus macrosporus DSM 14697]
MGHVYILRDFASPHEGRSRTVRIYTPDADDASPDRSFSVLDMQDGQNVFAHPESARFDTWCANLTSERITQDAYAQKKAERLTRWTRRPAAPGARRAAWAPG